MAMLKINFENDWERKVEFGKLKNMELFYTGQGTENCFMKFNHDLIKDNVSYNAINLITGKSYEFVQSAEVYRFKSAVLNLEK